MSRKTGQEQNAWTVSIPTAPPVPAEASASATTAPGTTPSQDLVDANPYTLAIVGHTHTYKRSGPREVIVGHGGAPLSSSVNYGYALVQQLENGDIRVDNIDYTTGMSVESFTVTP